MDDKCECPEHPVDDGPDEWTCPTCGLAWEKHWDVWWEPKDESWHRG